MGMEGETSAPPGWVQRALIGRRPKHTLVRIVVLVVLCVLARNYVLVPIRVEGISMLPTYKDHGVNFVNRLPYLFHEPQRGDVVGIRLAPGEHIMYLKRIIGLPGETLSFHHGRTFINGQMLDEPYVKHAGDWERVPELIGPDEYYVVGDNRSMDWNEHVQGRAKRERIVGKTLL